jgi:hypothetical protein
MTMLLGEGYFPRRPTPEMSALLRHRTFWMAVIAVVVPFGWLLLLVRLALRTINR